MPPQLPCGNASSSIKPQDLILALLFLHSQMISLIPVHLNNNLFWWLPNISTRSRLLFWTPNSIFKYLSNVASSMSLKDIKWARSKRELSIFLQTCPVYLPSPYSSHPCTGWQTSHQNAQTRTLEGILDWYFSLIFMPINKSCEFLSEKCILNSSSFR